MSNEKRRGKNMLINPKETYRMRYVKCSKRRNLVGLEFNITSLCHNYKILSKRQISQFKMKLKYRLANTRNSSAYFTTIHFSI